MNKYINADQFERDCMFDRECEGMQDVIYKLRDYPPADVVEVKHGKWIRLTDGWDGIDEYERYKCSVCNQPNSWGDTPFCRWCGADMRYEQSTIGVNRDVETIITGNTDGDYVKVVRCKDCKYVWEHENGCYECGYGFCEVRADFFCADGERRKTE